MTTRTFFRLLLLSLLVAITPTATAKVKYEGGDGSSIEKAVVIIAEGSLSGIQAEYEYIRKHFPGSKVEGQRLLGKDGKSYDAIDITDANGKKRTVYFDITSFFGK